jgi:hypothetical protein
MKRSLALVAAVALLVPAAFSQKATEYLAGRLAYLNASGIAREGSPAVNAFLGR